MHRQGVDVGGGLKIRLNMFASTVKAEIMYNHENSFKLKY